MVGSSRELYERKPEGDRRSPSSITHEFKLDDEDVAGIDYVFGSFYAGGPALAYANGRRSARSRYPTFADLQMATDGQGRSRAYLATEDNFRVLKRSSRTISSCRSWATSPGAKALRAVGAYLRAHGATVTTFYASNVEQYLFQDRLWADFASNVADAAARRDEHVHPILFQQLCSRRRVTDR